LVGVGSPDGISVESLGHGSGGHRLNRFIAFAQEDKCLRCVSFTPNSDAHGELAIGGTRCVPGGTSTTAQVLRRWQTVIVAARRVRQVVDDGGSGQSEKGEFGRGRTKTPCAKKAENTGVCTQKKGGRPGGILMFVDASGRGHSPWDRVKEVELHY